MAKQIDNTNTHNIDFDPANTSILLNVKDVKTDIQTNTQMDKEVNKNDEQREQNIQDADVGQAQIVELKPTNTANVEPKTEVKKRDIIYEWCASRRDKVLPFLGNNTQQFEKLARAFAIEIYSNAKLLSCDQLSIIQAFYKCCEYGLNPASSVQQVWMIPYNGKMDFQIGYKGWLQLLWRNKLVSNIYSYAVYEGDVFEYDLGLNPSIIHKPLVKGVKNLKGQSVDDAEEQSTNSERKLVATYGVIKFKNNEVQLGVCLKDELDRSKKSSRSNGREDSPWNKHFEAMALIVPIRKMAKNLALALRVEDYDEDYIDIVDTVNGTAANVNPNDNVIQ